MRDFIEYRSTLAYYDGPEVFEANDRIGGNYIGMMLDSDVETFKILVVGVSPKQMMRLRRGDVDLRSVILESAEFGWYTCETDSWEGQIPLTDKRTEPLTESMLPAKDYFLREPVASKNIAMVEAVKRSNFVVHLKIEPLNVLTRHRLRLKDYSDLISGLNSVIGSSWIPDSSDPDRANILNVDLDIVTPAATGSLEVVLEASTPDSDMFTPYHDLVSALRQFDDVVSGTLDEGSIEPLASTLNSIFAKKYMGLLKVLNRSEIDLQYSWAEPNLELGNIKNVSFAKTSGFVESIKARATEIMVESERVIQGDFVRFNRHTGSWGLELDDGTQVKGNIDSKECPDQLDGLIVGQPYTFTCVEKHTFGQVWRNEAPSLFLRQIEPEE